jgi:hypothetical protein
MSLFSESPALFVMGNHERRVGKRETGGRAKEDEDSQEIRKEGGKVNCGAETCGMQKIPNNGRLEKLV